MYMEKGKGLRIDIFTYTPIKRLRGFLTSLFRRKIKWWQKNEPKYEFLIQVYLMRALEQCFSTAGPRGRFCRSLGTYRQACEQYACPIISLMASKIIILFYYFIIISFLLSEIKSYRSAMVILKIFWSAVPKGLKNTALEGNDWCVSRVKTL